MEKLKIRVTLQATEDIKEIKRYILETFKYREYGNSFVTGIKKAISTLEYGASGYQKTGYLYKGSIVYIKPYDTYIIVYYIKGKELYVLNILKDRMLWQSTIKRMPGMEEIIL